MVDTFLQHGSPLEICFVGAVIPFLTWSPLRSCLLIAWGVKMSTHEVWKALKNRDARLLYICKCQHRDRNTRALASFLGQNPKQEERENAFPPLGWRCTAYQCVTWFYILLWTLQLYDFLIEVTEFTRLSAKHNCENAVSLVHKHLSSDSWTFCRNHTDPKWQCWLWQVELHLCLFPKRRVIFFLHQDGV